MESNPKLNFQANRVHQGMGPVNNAKRSQLLYSEPDMEKGNPEHDPNRVTQEIELITILFEHCCIKVKLQVQHVRNV